MLNIVLWLFQILMALLFGMHGRTLLFLPDPVPEPMGWVHDVWGPFRIFIGLAEVAAAVALLAPGIARKLRPEGTIARFTILTPWPLGGWHLSWSAPLSSMGCAGRSPTCLSTW